MSAVTPIEKMRLEWNRRAKADAHFYVAFERLQQSTEEFLAGASEPVAGCLREFVRLPACPIADRRALEIGCGPGRLMRPLSAYFGEIHGVDISDEMVALAREQLKDVPNARVHLNSGSDLAAFSDNYFDFVYSYIVLQHIPSPAIVLAYLREARRVLKPGGVLWCQLRGVPPLETDMKLESETWTGCNFTASDIADFSLDSRFPLVAIEGIGTQYMFTTFRKPAGTGPVFTPSEVILHGATSGTGGKSVPARGRESVVSLWIENFPHDTGLASFPVAFGERVQMGCYLSQIDSVNGCQMNVLVPRGIELGPVEVGLLHQSRPAGARHVVEITAGPPYRPRVTKVTDGLNLASNLRLETGGGKVYLEDVAEPGEVSVTVGGWRPVFLHYASIDPAVAGFQFAFQMPDTLTPGTYPLVVTVSGQPLEPIVVEVV